MPRSTAARSSEIISCLSGSRPYEALIPMQPSPSAETSRLLLPSLRFCIVTPFADDCSHNKAQKAQERIPLRKTLLCFCVFCGQVYAARGTRAGTFGLLGTVAWAECDKADLISRQWIEISAKTSAIARHDQMIACTTSTPSLSHPVTPITNRAAMKTSASA